MAAAGGQGLSRVSSAMPKLGTAVMVWVAGMATGMVLFAALHKAGIPGVIAPALALGVVILLRFPLLSTALLLIGVVLFEPVDPGLLPTFNSFYVVVRYSLTPVDLLLYLGLAGLLLQFAIEGRRPRLPEPITGALLLLSLATVAGVITGYTANAAVSNGTLYHRALNDAYIILIPLLVVNVIRDTRALRAFLVVVAGLAAFKGLSGVYSALSGHGSQLTEETVSFLEPVPNLVMLMFVLGTAAALVRRQHLPAWILAGAPLALLALLLSYRRSFWIAAIFTLLLVVIIASRQRGRTVLVIGGVALVLTAVTAVTIGATGPAASPLVKRAQQLSPSGIEADRGDRYRNDERKNVLANIERNPFTGLGLGVRWKVYYPLAESHDRTYVHFAFLWFWIAYGPLGAIAYVFLMATGMWTARAIWRRHPDPIVQIGAIAAFGTVLGIVIVELTTTFTGIEPRFSIVVGGLFGWLAAAWRDIPRRERLPAGTP
jgi:hypothetical protein